MDAAEYIPTEDAEDYDELDSLSTTERKGPSRGFIGDLATRMGVGYFVFMVTLLGLFAGGALLCVSYFIEMLAGGGAGGLRH